MDNSRCEVPSGSTSSFVRNLPRENSGGLSFQRIVVLVDALSERGRGEFSAIAQIRGDSYLTELVSRIAKHTEPDEAGAGALWKEYVS